VADQRFGVYACQFLLANRERDDRNIRCFNVFICRGAAEQDSLQRGGEVLFSSLLRCFIPFRVKRTRLQPGPF
jgi:hypothetical protein